MCNTPAGDMCHMPGAYPLHILAYTFNKAKPVSAVVAWKLVSYSADHVNVYTTRGKTALHLAASMGNEDCFKVYIA